MELDKDWEDIMLVPSVLDLMFTLYWKIRENPHLAHHVRTCLVQMVNLSGTKTQSEEMEMQYFTSYMERFIKLITSVHIIDEEASGIANIIKKLFTSFQKKFYSLSTDMMKTFLEQMSRLTCMFLENAAQEESVSNSKLQIKNDCIINNKIILFVVVKHRRMFIYRSSRCFIRCVVVYFIRKRFILSGIS